MIKFILLFVTVTQLSLMSKADSAVIYDCVARGTQTLEVVSSPDFKQQIVYLQYPEKKMIRFLSEGELMPGAVTAFQDLTVLDVAVDAISGTDFISIRTFKKSASDTQSVGVLTIGTGEIVKTDEVLCQRAPESSEPKP